MACLSHLDFGRKLVERFAGYCIARCGKTLRARSLRSFSIESQRLTSFRALQKCDKISQKSFQILWNVFFKNLSPFSFSSSSIRLRPPYGHLQSYWGDHQYLNRRGDAFTATQCGRVRVTLKYSPGGRMANFRGLNLRTQLEQATKGFSPAVIVARGFQSTDFSARRVNLYALLSLITVPRGRARSTSVRIYTVL